MFKNICKVIFCIIVQLHAVELSLSQKLCAKETVLEEISRKIIAKQEQIFVLEERIDKLRKATLQAIENDLKKEGKSAEFIAEKLIVAEKLIDEAAIDFVKIFTAELLITKRHSITGFFDHDFITSNYAEMLMFNRLLCYYEQLALRELMKKWEEVMIEIEKIKKTCPNS